MKRDKPLKRLMLVEWADAHSPSCYAWKLHGDIREDSGKPLTCLSVGWVLHEDHEVLVLLPHSYAWKGKPCAKGCGELSIPRGCVRQVVELKGWRRALRAGRRKQ